MNYHYANVRDDGNKLRLVSVPLEATAVDDDAFKINNQPVVFDKNKWEGISPVIFPVTANFAGFKDSDILDAHKGHSVVTNAEFKKLVQDEVFPQEFVDQLATHLNFYSLDNIDIQRSEFLAVAGCEGTSHRVRLGGAKGPNQHRLHKHGRFDFRTETRKAYTNVYVVFKHPSMCQYVNDAVDCIPWGVASAVVTAALSESVDIGLKMFYPVWYTCFSVKVGLTTAKEMGLEIIVESEHSCWSNHC